MRQWDIYLFPFSEELPHPVVILSTDERAAARKHVNGLICISLRGRALALHEVLLDRADGLDWETAARCDLVHLLARDRFQELRGASARIARFRSVESLSSASG